MADITTYGTMVISIHALVKRATYFKHYRRYFAIYFNPRPRKEGDNIIIFAFANIRDFNPRPRKEGDQIKP